MPIFETTNWRDGRWGDGEPQTVTVVWGEKGTDLQAEVAKFLHCKREDVFRVLRELRDEDLPRLLTTKPRMVKSKVTGKPRAKDARLTRRIRVDYGGSTGMVYRRGYVFAGDYYGGGWHTFRPSPPVTKRSRKGQDEPAKAGRFVGGLEDLRW